MTNTTAALIVPASNSTDTGDLTTSLIVGFSAWAVLLFIPYYRYRQEARRANDNVRPTIEQIQYYLLFWTILLPATFWYFVFGGRKKLPDISKGYAFTLAQDQARAQAQAQGLSVTPPMANPPKTSSSGSTTNNVVRPTNELQMALPLTPQDQLPGVGETLLQQDIDAIQKKINEIQKEIAENKQFSENKFKEILEKLIQLSAKIESGPQTRFLPQINYLRSQLYNKIQPDAMHLRL